MCFPREGIFAGFVATLRCEGLGNMKQQETNDQQLLE